MSAIEDHNLVVLHETSGEGRTNKPGAAGQKDSLIADHGSEVTFARQTANPGDVQEETVCTRNGARQTDIPSIAMLIDAPVGDHQ